MSEPTKVSELLKKGTKIVTCKTGNIYKIRKMPLPAMAKFFNAIDIKLSKDMNAMNASMQEQMTNPGKIEKLILAMREVLPQCITDPKVSAIEPSSDIVINTDDLPIDDQFELFGIITDFSGFSADKMKENETFRPEPDR